MFVDDIAANIRGAAEAGMVGIHHVETEQTLAELEVLLGISVRP